MDNMQSAFLEMFGDRQTITIPRMLVDYFEGDLTTAFVLNQIIFYDRITKRTDGYFYKTYAEWEEETGLTKRKVSYAADKLKEMGFLETTHKRAQGLRTVHYKLNKDNMLHAVVTKCHSRSEQNVTSGRDKMLRPVTEDLEQKNYTEHKTVPSAGIPYKQIIEYLNEKTGSSYKHTAKTNQDKIRARWKEGHRLEDFLVVIDYLSKEWSGAVFKNGQPGEFYLRPKTLFNTDFDEKLQQARRKTITTNRSRAGSGRENYLGDDDLMPGG